MVETNQLEEFWQANVNDLDNLMEVTPGREKPFLSYVLFEDH